MSWPCTQLDYVKAPSKYSLVGGPFGSELTTRDYIDEGVPVIRGCNLTEGHFLDKDFVFVSEQKADSLSSNLAYPGDLVFTQRGTLGQVGFIPEDARFRRYVISQSQMKLTVDQDVANPLFFYYYFKLPSTVTQIRNLASSSGVPHINLGTLKAFVVPLPPLAVQNKIASVVLCYDRLIENNRHRIKLLEAAARMIYREWFVRLRFPGYEHTKIENRVPQGWHDGTLAEFYDTTSGGTPSRSNPDFYTGEINWVKTQELNENFIFKTEERITEQAVKSSAAKLFPAGTLLVSIYGNANIGRTGILAEPGACNQACVALFQKHKSSSTLFAQLFIQACRENLISMSQGAAQTNISQQTLRAVRMVLPSKAVMDMFLETVTPVYELKKNLEKQIADLIQARDILLPRLMSGEIEI